MIPWLILIYHMLMYSILAMSAYIINPTGGTGYSRDIQQAIGHWTNPQTFELGL